MKIGIFGTFDLENWGDLLFPLAAREALEKRLPDVEIVPWSYQEKSAGEWPYPVRGLADLGNDAAGLDAILIGGGHLIRFDKNVAENYFPPVRSLHHPTSYWLLPALLGAEFGIPVIWNGPSSSKNLPDWAAPMLKPALRRASVSAFRDQTTIQELRRFAPLPDAKVIPDTALGLRVFQDRGVDDDLPGRLGIRRPYVLVHASPRNNEFALPIAAAGKAMPEHQFVEIQIGPAIGDRLGGFSQPSLSGMLRLEPWPKPMEIAKLVAASAGVITTSLHLSLTAIASGLPVLRPVEKPGSKYAPLEDYRNVLSMKRNRPDGGIEFASRVRHGFAPSDMSATLSALDAHWDTVASVIVSSAREKKNRRNAEHFAFLARLPFFLEEQGLAG